MGYTRSFLLRTKPNARSNELEHDLQTNLAPALYNGGTGFKFRLDCDVYEASEIDKLTTLSTRWPDFEFLAIEVGEECWDDYCGHRHDAHVWIVQNGTAKEY